MNKEILNQYISLKKEAADEQRRIDQTEQEIRAMIPKAKQVADKVSCGKRGKKPLGNVTIRGFGDQTAINRKRAALRVRKAKQELRLAKLETMVCDIEDFIDQIEDSEIRRIMKYFYIDGLSWAQTAIAMGEGYTPDGCRKRLKRFFVK